MSTAVTYLFVPGDRPERFDKAAAAGPDVMVLDLEDAVHPDAKPKEVDLDLDTKGWVAGLPDSQFTSPRQLGELLARTPQCQECVVKQVFRYMSGRQDTPADRPVLNQAL